MSIQHHITKQSEVSEPKRCPLLGCSCSYLFWFCAILILPASWSWRLTYSSTWGSIFDGILANALRQNNYVPIRRYESMQLRRFGDLVERGVRYHQLSPEYLFPCWDAHLPPRFFSPASQCSQSTIGSQKQILGIMTWRSGTFNISSYVCILGHPRPARISEVQVQVNFGSIITLHVK